MAIEHSADILVVGGSIAGMAAAITAKEANPALDVMVVEKYTSGYAGKANRGAGIMLLRGKYSAEEFVAYQVDRIGKYMNDQDALRQYAENLNEGVEELDRWSGGKFAKDENGVIKTLKWRSQIKSEDENGKRTFIEENEYPWTLAAIDLDYMPNVRKHAVKLGIRFVDRVGIVDLLLDDGAISGAVGYNIDDAEQNIFKAKAVVMACGCQNYRIMNMWSPARGEGVAAAWRAGVSLANNEFSSFYNWMSPQHFESEMGVEYALYNDKGENVGLQHTKEPHPDIDQDSLAEWYKQVKAGNGPMHYHMQENILMPFLSSMLASDSYFVRPYTDRLYGYIFFNAFSQQTSDQIIPGLIGEHGPIQVDLNMATRVPGLYAAGDICYAGTRGFGAVPVSPGRMRGAGLAFATYSGRIAGPAAVEYARGAALGAVHNEQLQEIDTRFTAPLKRTGDMTVNAFVYEIQKVMNPLGSSLYRSEERMKKCLARILELKEQQARVEAKDPHHLFGCNEISAMLLCAEMFFRSSLERKESIGWFLREDYPDMPENRVWYVIDNVNGEPVIRVEDVPVTKYKYQPN